MPDGTICHNLVKSHYNK